MIAGTNEEIRVAFTPGNKVALHHGNDVGTEYEGGWANGRFLRMRDNGDVNGGGGWRKVMNLPPDWPSERFTVLTPDPSSPIF